MGRSGSGAINTVVATLSGTGTVIDSTKTGSGAIDTTVPTLSGTGTRIITSTGAISTVVPTLAGQGAEPVSGNPLGLLLALTKD
jgi:hypothetical protein